MLLLCVATINGSSKVKDFWCSKSNKNSMSNIWYLHEIMDLNKTIETIRKCFCFEKNNFTCINVNFCIQDFLQEYTETIKHPKEIWTIDTTISSLLVPRFVTATATIVPAPCWATRTYEYKTKQKGRNQPTNYGYKYTKHPH